MDLEEFEADSATRRAPILNESMMNIYLNWVY
jgi:hypothetical protein